MVEQAGCAVRLSLSVDETILLRVVRIRNYVARNVRLGWRLFVYLIEGGVDVDEAATAIIVIVAVTVIVIAIVAAKTIVIAIVSGLADRYTSIKTQGKAR